MPARVRRSAASLQNNPYGRAHQAERQALLPHAYGQPCPGPCGRTMHAGMRLDLDHVPPLALHHHTPGSGCCHGRIVCARCNRAAGARLGNRLRRQRIISQRQPSRRW